MKKLFIYYSETGNGDVVADLFKTKKYDVEKINAKKLPKIRLFQILVGGFKASVGIKDKIRDLTNNIDNYEDIIIGSPIWNGRLSSPVRGLLSKYDFSDKRLYFVLYSASGEANAAEKFIKKEYPNAEVIVLKQPKKYKEELLKLKD